MGAGMAPMFMWHGPSAQGLSHRSVFNLNYSTVPDYLFIDFLNTGSSFFNPVGYNNTPPLWNSATMDASGYPCTNQINASCPNSGTNSAQSTRSFGGGLAVPSSTNYSDYWCLQGQGSGTVTFTTPPSPPSSSWAIATAHTVTCGAYNGGSANNCPDHVTGSGGGPFTVTDETWSGWCIALTYSGPIGLGKLFFSNDDPNNSGHYIKALHLYERPDGTDLANGLMFRRSTKQLIASLDPSYVRFLNWDWGFGYDMRFEDRATPTSVPFVSQLGGQLGTSGKFSGLLPYSVASCCTGGVPGQYTMSAVTGTPASMKHGERAMFLAPNNAAGAGYAPAITNIAKSGTTITLTTGDATLATVSSTASGNNTLHFNSNYPQPQSGEYVLDLTTPSAIPNNTTVSSTTSSTLVMSANAAGSGVGSGDVIATGGPTIPLSTGDTAVLFNNVNNSSPGVYLTNYFATNITVTNNIQVTFTFTNASSVPTCSSNCGNIADAFTLQVGSGNDRTPYPIILDNGTFYAQYGNIKLGYGYDMCFNKNFAGQSDGSGNALYGAWITCEDPPFPVEYEIELVNELNALNPTYPIGMWINTTAMSLICDSYYSDPDCSAGSDFPANLVKTIFNGANGFAGLAAPAPLMIEDDNENFNPTQSAALLRIFGSQPATVGKVGCATGDPNSYPVLHSELVMNDIKNSGYAVAGRTFYTLGGQQTDPGTTVARMTGAFGISGCQPPAPALVPITMYDALNTAVYFDSDSTQFSNLSTYAAQWASDATTFGFNSSQALADLALWSGPLTNSVNCCSIAALEAITTSDYLPVMATYGKTAINYEGAWDDGITQFLTITGISCTSGTVTITTTSPFFATGNTPYQSPMQIAGVSVAGYNGFFTTSGNANSFTYTLGGGCPAGTPAISYQGYYGYTTFETNAFLRAVDDSAAWGTSELGYMNFVNAGPNMAIPGIYIETDFHWGFTWGDIYGTTTTEGGSLSPAWNSIQTYNNSHN
jgi:hypothetical protein